MYGHFRTTTLKPTKTEAGAINSVIEATKVPQLIKVGSRIATPHTGELVSCLYGEHFFSFPQTHVQSRGRLLHFTLQAAKFGQNMYR
jgi:hypothetical protein